MRFLGELTLQKRISLLVFLGLALGLGLFSWLGIQSLNESTQRTLEERLTISRIVASALDETLNNVLVLSKDAANFHGEFPTEAGFRQRAEALASLLGESGIGTEGVYLLGSDGKILQVEPSRPGAIGLVTSERPVQGPAISTLTYAPVSGVPVVFATAPLWEPSGKNIGALAIAIEISESSISGFIKPLTLGSTGYTEIVDANGVVLARTQPGRPPAAFERSDHPGRFAQLMQEGVAAVRTCHRCHGEESQPQRRRDVLAFAPLSAAPWGVAIRQSEEEAFLITNQLQRRLLLLGGVVVVSVFLLVWLVMQGVVRPIKMLTVASSRVAGGDFRAIAPLRRRDELGQLSAAFAGMTADLAHAREELVSRNQELSALNSIAATVSQSLDLGEVLPKALQKVTEVMDSDAACLFLRDFENQGLRLAARRGAFGLFNCRESSLAAGCCACHQVLRLGRTLMVNDVSQCPRLDHTEAEGIVCFVSVPLKSKEKALGAMNVACSGEWSFTEDDFRLLDSIGYHVGLAIENSMLYQEAKQKEELRGQLLTAVIGAEEEERKRISRDLHDGCGQLLTGLIMSIESSENAVPPDSVVLKERLAGSRRIATQALEDMRKLMRGLRPTVLDDLGLVAALRSYAETRLEAAGVRVEFEAQGLNRRLSPSLETALFRIGQEAIHNILRHARTPSATIQLAATNGKVRLVVEDTGRGFDMASLGRGHSAPSLGLLGMRERAALLGGSFSIASTPGQGTRIIVEIPVDNSAHGKETDGQ